MITQTVENWTHSDSQPRLKIPIGILYEADVRLAMQLCFESAAATERVFKNPEPKCLLIGFGASAVDLELRIWIQNAHMGVRNDVLLRVWDKFHEHGIEISCPQRDLHIRSSQTAPVGVLAGSAI